MLDDPEALFRLTMHIRRYKIRWTGVKPLAELCLLHAWREMAGGTHRCIIAGPRHFHGFIIEGWRGDITRVAFDRTFTRRFKNSMDP